MKIKYWAVMLGCEGTEFGASVEASSRMEAYDILAADYPESRCVQLEDEEDRQRREQEMHERLQREYDEDYGYEEEY